MKTEYHKRHIAVARDGGAVVFVIVWCHCLVSCCFSVQGKRVGNMLCKIVQRELELLVEIGVENTERSKKNLDVISKRLFNRTLTVLWRDLHRFYLVVSLRKSFPILFRMTEKTKEYPLKQFTRYLVHGCQKNLLWAINSETLRGHMFVMLSLFQWIFIKDDLWILSPYQHH